MAKQIQLRRGTTTEHNTFTGAVGELTYDTEKKQLRVHDGSTVGGKVVDDPIPDATETVAGKAKIATTAIAQAGTNDADFLTAKKLRAALNATGNAPISACRAWITVNTKTSTILNSMNIQSFTKESTGRFKITFINPMPHSNYAAFTNNIGVIGVATGSNTIVCSFDAQITNTVNDCYFWAWSTTNGGLNDLDLLNIGVFC